MMNTPDMHLKETQEVLQRIQILKQNYLMQWKPEDGESGWAIAQVFAEMAASLNTTLNKVPNKLFLSYLNALNFTQKAPLFATVPVTFTLTKGFKNSVVIPERTELSTKEKVVFETEESFTATSAKLCAIVCVDPQSNSVDDFSSSIGSDEVITLFENKQDQQYLYFGDDALFNIHRVAGDTNAYIDYVVPNIECDVWQYFGKSVLDEEAYWVDFERSGNHLNKNKSYTTVKKEINGIETYWIRAVLKRPQKEQSNQYTIAYKSCSGIDGLYYNAQPLNPRKIIQPFGKKPHEQDTFYIASSEAFSKKGALCGIAFDGVFCSYESTGNVRLYKKHAIYGSVSFEYYNGQAWKKLSIQKDIDKSVLNMAVDLVFYIPNDISEVAVNGDKNFWIRLKLIEHTYGAYIYNQAENKLEDNFTEPSFKKIDIYVKSKIQTPHHVLRYAHKSYTNLLASSDNLPYSWVDEMLSQEKSLYLGFDKGFDEGLISMLIRVENSAAQINTSNYFFYNNNSWQKLLVKDRSNGFAKSALLSFVAPLYQQALRIFDKELYWLKISFDYDVDPIQMQGLYLNSVMATQCKSVDKKLLGSSDGSAFQSFSLQEKPALYPCVWVRETTLPNTKNYYEDEYGEGYWVEWQEVSNLSEERYNQRVYSFDTHTSTVRFADGKKGMIPPIAKNNILISYKFGGGSSGNVEVGKINKIVSSLAYVDTVTNFESAMGGADEQSIESLIEKAPKCIKHHYSAVTEDDFNTLVKEASSSVAKVRTMMSPGKIDLVIIPYSKVKKPLSSLALKKQVLEYIEARTSATVKVNVIDPKYSQIDIRLSIVVSDWSLASTLKNTIHEALDKFLHPLEGAADGEGWSFGSVPNLSDIFHLLGEYEGISYIERAAIILNGELLYDMDGESTSKIANDVMLYSGDHLVEIVVRSI